MLIRVGQLNLKLNPPVSFTPAQLRGAIASSWPEQGLLHQHEDAVQQEPGLGSESNKVVYICPRIRYGLKNNSTALITGIEDGVPILEELARRLDQAQLCLGQMKTKIEAASLIKTESNFGFPNDTHDKNHLCLSYSFLTPWLALNEENYERYKAAGPKEQKDLLRRILIGNILSMSKGLRYVVTQEIKVSKLDVYPVRTPVRLKGVGMTGFKGTFSVNFELPDYIGLGKSVSRGFGTIKRVRGSATLEDIAGF